MNPISLGTLEQEVMSYVWSSKKCTARDTFNHITKNRKIAYTTVQTVMTRLVSKGILKRNLKGKTHTYYPVLEKKATLRSAINKVMGGFMNQFEDDAVIAFMEGLENISESTRKKLIKKLQTK